MHAGKFVELSEGITHYRLFGEASEHSPVLVCVSDFATSHEIWDLFAMDFKLSGYAVLTYDLYGAHTLSPWWHSADGTVCCHSHTGLILDV